MCVCVFVFMCDGGGVNVWASGRYLVNAAVEERQERWLLGNEIQCDGVVIFSI